MRVRISRILVELKHWVDRHSYVSVAISTIKNYVGGRIGREAIALSFYTAIATVPMVAVALFVTNWFGVEKNLSDMLYETFPTSTDMISSIMEMAHNVLQALDNGLFGWISFISFIWMVIWLMINIEIAFNLIWEVGSQRNLMKRLGIYATILMVMPFILMLFLFGWGYYAKFISHLEGNLGAFNFLTHNIFWLIFYGVATIAIQIMFKFIPHAKVRTRAAGASAAITALAFVIVQYLYMETQIMVTGINAVYGVLAFVPLFLVWLNICWQIILMGASLSYSFNQFLEKKSKEKEESK